MNVQIAQRLAELRRAKGYSQESLARELGLSRQAVSKWERAESSPDTENLIALARLYGVSLDELLSVDADIADDIAFENAERADKTAADDAARAADRETAAQAEKAARAYKDINLLAMKLLRPGGKLFTFSCSGASPSSESFRGPAIRCGRTRMAIFSPPTTPTEEN